MRRPLAALLILLAALAAGCGTGSSSAGDFEGDEKAVAEQVERIQTAGQRRDGESICTDVLAEELRERLTAGNSTCEQELDKVIEDADDFELTVRDVEISGQTASAKVEGRVGSAKQVRTLEFVREGEDWRATSLGS